MISPLSRIPSHLIHRIVPCGFSNNFSKKFVSFTTKSSSSSSIMNQNKNQNNIVGREIDLLDTKDLRFRLPGNVGIVNDLWLLKIRNLNENKNLKQQQQQQQQLQQNEQKQENFNNKIITISHEELINRMSDDKAMPNTQSFYDNEDEFEMLNCEAHECPLLLIKDFQELFPHNNLNLSNGLTVMTITYKTINDMSVWSKEVDNEREKLLEKFVQIAQRMCNYLKENGYWADFVDPSSGRPYYGDYTPATFFETDERYRRFGFEIEDLGCCKVLSHKLWGTNAFVGALFTNATHNSDVVQRLVITLD